MLVDSGLRHSPPQFKLEKPPERYLIRDLRRGISYLEWYFLDRWTIPSVNKIGCHLTAENGRRQYPTHAVGTRGMGALKVGLVISWPSHFRPIMFQWSGNGFYNGVF